MGKLIVVVGGQFGSEGKGMIAGHLAATEPNPILSIRVAGPNAGHTVWGWEDADERGRPKHDETKPMEFKLQQIPVAAVTRPDQPVAIAAGSEIDPKTLENEARRLGYADRPELLLIDPEATIIEERHVYLERGHKLNEPSQLADHGEGGLTYRIGSTGKGVGAARADRLMRGATRFEEAHRRELESGARVPWTMADVSGAARQALNDGWTVLVEGTQGYGLGLHAGFYPYCTSSDCRAVDFLAMAGISPWATYVEKIEVWVVLRTYPIRVAGNSGPMFKELDWADLGAKSAGHIKPEQTTVTKKTRRIGDWDRDLAQAAVVANGENVKVALTFFDYWYPEIYNSEELGPYGWGDIGNLERALGAPIQIVGTGPRSVADLRSNR